MGQGATIITGAASGLGRAVAQRLAADAAPLALVDRDEAALDEVAGQLGASGATVTTAVADVSDWPSVEQAVGRVRSTHGTIARLVNAAAIQRFAHAHELDVTDWNRILAVNLTGTYLMCRAVLPSMIEAGSGAIVNVASTAGLTGMAYDAAYCAAKGGVVQLTKSLAVEYSQQGIRVNAVAPGGMQTPMLHVPLPADASPLLQQRIRRSLIGVAEPDAVANVVCFLLSDAASYMTGSIVVADGGALA